MSTRRLLLLALANESLSDDLILMALLEAKSRKRRFWIHQIHKQRKQFGAFYHLVRHLELDRTKYFEYFRMSPSDMEHLLTCVGPIISKNPAVREVIDAKERLALCVR